MTMNKNKQEGHSGPELLTCTMCISQKDYVTPGEVNFGPRDIFEQTW